MRTQFDVRARLYTVGGAAGRVLPTLDLGGSIPFDSIGTLRCSVSRRTFGTLDAVLETALEYWDPDAGAAGEWIEPLNGRFLIRDQGNDERDRSDTVTLQGATMWDWLARKALVDTGDFELVDGHRPFNSSTGGAILKTLIDEAQTRGWGPALDYDFTATTDSDGEPWALELSIAYQPGRTTLLMVLDNLVEQGVVERAVEGRTLHLYNPGHGVDRSEGAGRVRVGSSATQMPIRRNIDDLVTDVAFFGESGFRLDLENTGAYSGLGRLEAAIVQGGVNDEGTATLLGEPTMLAGRAAREQVAATEYTARALALPWKHYQGGDWVSGRRGSGEFEKLRVRAIVFTKTVGNEITVSPTLNDRFEDVLARLAKRTSGILGGAVAGGTGAVPNDSEDNRKPKAPTDLLVVSSGYWDPDGASKSQVSFDWADVTEGENDVAIDVAQYEVSGRLDDGATPPSFTLLSVPSSATASPFEPGTAWLFKVRAQSVNGIWGEWSDEAPVTMTDADPLLEKPVAPIVTSANRVVIVATTGLFDTDPPTTAPAWFREFSIRRSPNIGGPYVPVGTLNRDVDARVFNDMATGDGWYWILVPIDRLENEGPASDPTFVEVVGINGADIIFGSAHGDILEIGSLKVNRVEPGFGAALELDGNVTIVSQQEAIDAVESDVATVAGDLAATDSNLATMQTYYTFGPSGAIITSPGSDYSQRIASDRTEMRQGTQVVSYWEAGQMVVPRLVTETVKLGNHQWEKAGTAGSVIRALS